MRSEILIILLATVLGAASASAGVLLDFPSAGSTVVCSEADCFGDPTKVGYFWLESRGDSVEETFSTALPAVSDAAFDLAVPTNSLTEDANWDVLLNGQAIGSFTVDPNSPQRLYLEYSFPPINGPDYTVRIEMTNDVSIGGGSMRLGYAGIDRSTVTLSAPDPVDDLQCWQAKDLKAPKFVKIDDLPVSDAFATGTVDVKKPSLFCAPASVDGSMIHDPMATLCCYAVKGQKLKPADAIGIDDAFGSLALQIKKPKLLCTPCSESP